MAVTAYLIFFVLNDKTLNHVKVRFAYIPKLNLTLVSEYPIMCEVISSIINDIPNLNNITIAIEIRCLCIKPPVYCTC